MARRKYSDRERAEGLAALTANRGNLSATVKETGIPLKTLSDWRDGKIPDIAQLRAEKEEDLATIWQRVTRLYLGRAELAECIADTKGKDAIMAAAIACDKHLLLTGAATARTEIVDATKLANSLVQLAKERGDSLTAQEAQSLMEASLARAESVH